MKNYNQKGRFLRRARASKTLQKEICPVGNNKLLNKLEVFLFIFFGL